jgi:hypothetical protein
MFSEPDLSSVLTSTPREAQSLLGFCAQIIANSLHHALVTGLVDTKELTKGRKRIGPLTTLQARVRTPINVVARFPEHLDVFGVATDGRTMRNW